MKTISINEAAEALGVSPGTIQLRLQRGDLKGTRSKNHLGVTEWRVFLSQKHPGKIPGSELISFSPKDIIEPSDFDGPDQEEELRAWRQAEMERLDLIAQTLLKPLTDKIEAQAIALREQAVLIEEQSQKLRLLPDLEKLAREESEAAKMERESAELHKLQNLKLQEQVSELSDARDSRLQEISVLQTEIATLNAQLKSAQRPWWLKLFSLS